jgi:tetratricopeptide (TPR) repeat protein
MALVPLEQSDKLADLELKDSALYDHVYQIQDALDRHDREAAMAVWQTLRAAHPEHRLTHWSRLIIAWYDDDNAQILATVETLLEQFPEDANLKMNKIFALRTLSRSAERLAYLAELCAWNKRDEPAADNESSDVIAIDTNEVDVSSGASAPSVSSPADSDADPELTEKEKKDPRRYFDPLFWQQYAEELSTDARMHGKALRLIQRVLRYRSQDAHSISLLANILWAQRRFEIAAELYRFAACLKDTNEHYVQSYFIAARYLGQRQNALQHLESRFQRFGKRSGAPARTLSSALEQVGDDVRALAVLDEALALRPEDGELWLYASDAHGRNGNFDKAEQYAAQAEGKAPRTACLRGKALIAFYRGDLAVALQHWRDILEAEPQAIDATRNVSRLIAETEGREASHAFLRERCERFPHNYPLNQTLVEALREDPAAAEQALRRLIEIDPNEPWARRELAYKLIELHRYDEAQREAATAHQLEPASPFSFCTRGAVQAARGEVAEARESFKEAIRLSADTEFAIGELMNHSHTSAEKRDALALLAEELEKQVTFGEGVLAYRQYANATLPMDDVQAFLQRALDARPDLPLVWTAMIQQLVDMQRLDDALRVGEEATQRFPLLPRLWLDLASVQQVRLNVAGEITALQQALRIAPKWGFAAQQLADAYLRAGEKTKAIEILERAIALTPLDPYNHGCLADVLWKLNEKDQALARVQQSLKLDPEYEWGWRALRDWATDRKQPELATELARGLTQQRPGHALAWLTLARTVTDSRKLDERLAAVDRALALQPRMIEAHALKARLYSQAHRFDEARAACRPAVFGEQVPAGLRIVVANVEAERGAVNDAVKLLREIVTDEPNFYPAWAQLADWYRTNKDHGYYREAAEAMARLQPHYPIALGYLAEARQLTLDRAGAKEALQRALQLDPMYEYGAVTLFDWQYEDKEWDACATTIAHLKQYLGGDETYLRELKLALHHEDFQMARQRLQELCVSESEERQALDQALSAATIAGVDMPQAERWKQEADSVLDYVVDARLANANAVSAWVERNAKREQYDKVQQWLDALPERDDLWRRGSIVFLEALVAARKKHRVRTYATHHQVALRAHDWSWGNVGYLYLDMKEPRSCIAWLNDWRERKELEPWMLWNLVLALHQRRQLKTAYEVSEHALTLPPDSTSDAHALLLAVEDFLRGDYELGSKRLEHVNVNALRDWDKFVYELASCLQDADHAHCRQESGQHISHQFILQRIAEARRQTADSRTSNVLIPLHRRTVWHIARRSGNPLLMMGVAVQLAWQTAWQSVFGDTER